MTFKNDVQIPKDRPIREIADEILARVGFSTELLEQKFDNEEKSHVFTSLSGRFIWLNECSKKLAKRTNEKDFMLNGIFELLQKNKHNVFLVTILRAFFESREEVFLFSSEVLLPNGGKTIAKYDIKRLDSKEGIPMVYELNVVTTNLTEDESKK